MGGARPAHATDDPICAVRLTHSGGIGGLLAVCDPNDPCDPADTAGDFVYTYDANGNVGQLIDGTPTSWNAGTVMVARRSAVI